MKKEIVNMHKWELYIEGERYNLRGYADKHPRLGEDVYIERTTSVQKYELEEDVLVYETRNTVYVCPLKYMITEPYKSIVTGHLEKLLQVLGVAENVLDKIIKASAYIALKRADENELAKRIVELQKVER